MTIYCTGNAILDIVQEIDTLPPGVKKGEMVPVYDKEAFSQTYDQYVTSGQISSGGSAANTAAALGQLGADVEMLFKDGDDQLAKIFRHDLHAVGVQAHAASDGAEGTSRAATFITPDGERSFLTYLGASTTLSPSDIPSSWQQMGEGDVVMLEGYMLLEPEPRKAVFALAQMAHARGAQLVFSISSPFVAQQHQQDMLDLIRDYDAFVVGNTREFEGLFGSVAQAKATMAAENIHGILTKSSQGAEIIRGANVREVPVAALPDGRTFENSNGAGDAFLAGVLYGMQKKWNDACIGALAAAMGAHAVTEHGARISRPMHAVATAVASDECIANDLDGQGSDIALAS